MMFVFATQAHFVQLFVCHAFLVLLGSSYCEEAIVVYDTACVVTLVSGHRR